MPEATTVTIENAQLIFRNFSGRETQYNREGDRNFHVVLDPDTAAHMSSLGWNVKQLRDRDEDTPGDFALEVAVGYKNKPPVIVTISSAGRTHIGEDSVDILDYAEIANVDLIINPYHWSVGDKSGIKAYLKTMFITLDEDELQRKYAMMED